MYLKVKGVAKQVRSTNMNRESKMARRMMLIVLTDFLCWMPVIVIGLLSLLGKFHDPEKQAYVWIAVFVLPVNSALNPILYTFSTPLVKRRVGEHTDSVISFLERTTRRPKTTQGKLLGSLFNKQRCFLATHVNRKWTFLYSWAVQWFCANPETNLFYKTNGILQYKYVRVKAC